MAQADLGSMYLRGEGILQDYVKAHMYFNLAAAGGISTVVNNRNSLAKKMTPAQIEKAQELARNWRPTNK